MKVNEDLSILFWLKRQKATKEGLVPIYVRITVKGCRTEFSSGKKIHPEYWDEESAIATSGTGMCYANIKSTFQTNALRIKLIDIGLIKIKP